MRDAREVARIVGTSAGIVVIREFPEIGGVSIDLYPTEGGAAGSTDRGNVDSDHTGAIADLLAFYHAK